MKRWLVEEGIESAAALPCTELSATAMGEALLPHKELLVKEEIEPLLKEVASLSADFIATIQAVVERPDLQSKFWRYLRLFVEVIEQ